MSSHVRGESAGDLVTGTYPRPMPEPVTLTGRYARVKPLSSADYADLYAATCGPGNEWLWTHRSVAMPTGLAGLWMHLAGVMETGGVAFALVPTEGPAAGTAAGIAALGAVRPEHGVLEIGDVMLGGPLQRTRAGTEARHLLMAYVLDQLGYRRLEWSCDRLDEPARRAAQRLGFRHEGTARHHMIVRGRSRDTDWFAVTDADWPRLRSAHRGWLAPDNVNASGDPLRSLREILEDQVG